MTKELALWPLEASEYLRDPFADVVPNSPTPCAWCEAEVSVQTKGSHGICKRHSQKVQADYARYRAGLN